MNSLPQWAGTIAVFDTETTGVDTDTARIVTATVALLDAHGAVLERHDWLIDPKVEIPAVASAVHGITTERAQADGISPDVGVAQIISALGAMLERGFPIVAFNAPYDFTILAREAKRYGLPPLEKPEPILDPLILDRQFDRYRRGKRTLTATITHYGVTIGQAHDAGEDAIAAGRLLQQLASKYSSQLSEDLLTVHAEQVRWAREQAASFQEWMRSNRDPEFVANGDWPIRSLE